jgi:hypothetical protein
MSRNAKKKPASWSLFCAPVSLSAFLALPVCADQYYYKNVGGGDWNSVADPYYAWFDQTTSSNADFPIDNAGSDANLYVLGSNGVVNTSVAYNYTYLTGLHSLNIGSGNTLTQSAGNTVMMSLNTEAIGVNGTGTYTQSAGTNTADIGMTLGFNSGQGIYNLSGTGTLNAFGLIVGEASPGVFNQSGGTITTPYLTNAHNSSGAYNLSGGTLNITGASTYTNYAGNGTITQSGSGLANITGTLYVGGALSSSGSSAAYNLQGGALSVGTLDLADIHSGTSIFNQTGGTLSYTTFLQTGGQYIGTLINATTYNYSGGTFTGRLVNQGTVNFSANFAASDGMEVDSSVTIPSGLTITLNGAGLDNEGGLNLAGGTLAGGGVLLNNNQISGYGTIGGSAGLVNNLQIGQSGGNLILSNTGANTNNGTIYLVPGYQFQLSGAGVTLNNYGSLNLDSAIVTGAGTLVNGSGGAIVGPGTITSSFSNTAGVLLVHPGTTNITQAFSNSGIVQLTDPASTLAGGTVTNTGTIMGQGEIGNAVVNTGIITPLSGSLNFGGTLTNNAGGTIRVATGTQAVVISGLTTNSGIISLTGGTFDNNGHALLNSNQITGYGTLSTGGLTNSGAFTLTGGTSTVNGDVINSAGKTINVKYNAAIFTGNVTNNGTIKTTGTTVTFAGTYNGNAYISDPSTNIFQNNVTVVGGGSMTGSVGDQYYMLGGTFLNQGTYTNTGFLQSSDPTTNSSTFTQGGTQNWSPGTTFTNTAGVGTFQSDAGSASGFNLVVNVTAGKVALGSPQHWAGLTVSGGGIVDVANNHLIISYGGSDPIGSIKAYLTSGYAGGAWNGIGINSSAANVNPGYALGYADGADGVVAGLPSGQIEVKYALYGDANLDGIVNGTDFAILAGKFGQAVSGWDKGDFDYNGIVNGSDFAKLAANFGKSASGAAVALPASEWAALDSFAVAHGLMADVPEPGGLVFAGLGAMGILNLRRRRMSF